MIASEKGSQQVTAGHRKVVGKSHSCQLYLYDAIGCNLQTTHEKCNESRVASM